MILERDLNSDFSWVKTPVKYLSCTSQFSFQIKAKSSFHMKEHLRPLGKEERQALRVTTAFHRKAVSINGN